MEHPTVHASNWFGIPVRDLNHAGVPECRPVAGRRADPGRGLGRTHQHAEGAIAGRHGLLRAHHRPRKAIASVCTLRHEGADVRACWLAVAVASAEPVAIGRRDGFMQVGHGEGAPHAS